MLLNLLNVIKFHRSYFFTNGAPYFSDSYGYEHFLSNAEPLFRVILEQVACPIWHKVARSKPLIGKGAGSNQIIILKQGKNSKKSIEQKEKIRSKIEINY